MWFLDTIPGGAESVDLGGASKSLLLPVTTAALYYQKSKTHWVGTKEL